MRIASIVLLCFVALLVAVAVAPAEAQTSLAVPLDRAVLIWDQPAPGPNQALPSEYVVTCGTQVTRIPATQQQIAIRDAVPGPGSYTCTVYADSRFGRSGDAVGPAFEAGYPPGDLVNVRIEVR